MIIYEARERIDSASLVDLGDPAALGGRVLSGAPRIAARIDFQQDGVSAGVFEATTGVVEITFPFSEHATIIEGEVTITDAAGAGHTYRPGDSYFIAQGAVVLWDVRGRRVRKSFLNITRP